MAKKLIQRFTMASILYLLFFSLHAQEKNEFTKQQVDSVLAIGSGISGAGKPVTGNGGGGWRSGSQGVMYNGPDPKPEWTKMPDDRTTGSVIRDGLLPPIKPLMELHLRDAVICVGGDGNYYLTGSSGDNIWAWADGVELWKSADLKQWIYMGLVWSIEKDGSWEKQWQNLHNKPARALWAPELHYIKGNYFICLSMPPTGISILKSTSGRPEGPYIHATTVTDKPFTTGIDPTLFEDSDGSVYFTCSGANRIAKMKDDLSDFAEPYHPVLLQDPDHDSSHHSVRCMKRGSNDLGTEGAILFKANGKYYLGAADDYEGRYSSCVAVSNNIYGPYIHRQETVPGGGGGNFFKDKKGNWWATYFGNDDQSPWREKPGIVKIGFETDGKVRVLGNQSIDGDIVLASPFCDHMVLQHNAIVPVWGSAGAGEKISVQLGGQTHNTVAGADGKWMVRLNKITAGGPYTLTIKGRNSIVIQDVYAGEVWVCSGQSNMDMTVAREDRYWCGVVNEKEEVANANYPLIRVFDTDYAPRIEPQENVKAKWELVSPQTVGHLSAAAYFFARDLQKKIHLPVGLITTAYGASTAEAWTRKEALESDTTFHRLLDSFKVKRIRYETDTIGKAIYDSAYKKYKLAYADAKASGKDEPKEPKNPDPVWDQHNPSVLWNGMVKPLIPYAIRGALWYQGESNSPTASIYRRIMATMISDWRDQWDQGKFPFIYVQLANIGKVIDSIPAKGGTEAIKREAQLQNLSIPNTAMVVAIDNADSNNMNNVHPKNKQEIGRRLALAAEAIAYGQKITYSGPLYTRMETQGNRIRLYFDHTGTGLIAKDGNLQGFAIAGPDKKFVWGNAVIDGNTIVVSSPLINEPVAVRYGWANNPPTGLYNKEHLPASPFRTDNW